VEGICDLGSMRFDVYHAPHTGVLLRAAADGIDAPRWERRGLREGGHALYADLRAREGVCRRNLHHVRGTGSAAIAVQGSATKGTGVAGASNSGYGGRFEGGKAQLLLIPGDSLGPPTGAHTKGEIYLDSTAPLCV
jgi:hypothetical protein